MRRLGLWLTMVIMVLMPVLAISQATGGSTDKTVKEGGSGNAPAGKKVTKSKTKAAGKKGSKDVKKVEEDGTGRKKI